MPIVATAGTATAAIAPRRPSWADMKAHYPSASVKTATLYDSMIGGKFVNLYKIKVYENSCAVRMSYALARSGMKLGLAPSENGSTKGGDGYTYWIRVNDLIAELKRRFKGADVELSLPPLPKKVLDDATLKKLIGERRKMGQQLLDAKLNGGRTASSPFKSAVGELRLAISPYGTGRRKSSHMHPVSTIPSAITTIFG